ncbi:hypothetical protein Q8F55_003762 [Vanrija albida]|uniref:Uncharacterized protein n=1 Tax=Vanrija albida TaxID=181172 RepID=A0ABR3Q4V2_9TREE
MAPREKLDVESAESREARLVLARARAFLPLLASSNADLLARAAADPASVDIEQGEGPAVAMDVGLGVFDVRGEVGDGLGPLVERDAGVWEAAEAAADEGEEGEEDDEGEDGDEGDEDEDESSDSSDDSDDDEEADAPDAMDTDK